MKENVIFVIDSKTSFTFFFQCSLYNELRTQYLSRYFVVRPSMYKLTELFKTEVKSVSKTCQYVRFIVQYTGLCADILVGGTSPPTRISVHKRVFVQ